MILHRLCNFFEAIFRESTLHPEFNFSERVDLTLPEKLNSAWSAPPRNPAVKKVAKSMLPIAILAGGLATRLKPLASKIPKALIDVAGKPFIFHQIESLCKYHVKRIVLCVGHLGKMIEDTVGKGERWGIEIIYSYDGDLLLGTGGSLKQALPLLGPQFLFLYGDTYLDCDYLKVAQAFTKSKKPGMMTVLFNQNQWDQSNILYCNGTILKYDKKNPCSAMQHIDYGLGGLSASVFAPYHALKTFDLTLIHQDLISKKELAGKEVTNRFYEIGTPQSLEETRKYLLETLQ